jgi:hypothetical protein
MPAPIIQPLPIAPNRADAPDVFVERADAFVAALGPFGGQVQSVGDFSEQQANLAEAQVGLAQQQVAFATEQAELATTNGQAQVALAALQAGAAAMSAQDAEDAATIASGAANYQGEYSPTVTYQVGQSVSYLGNRFIAKTINLNIVPVAGTNWLLIPDLDDTTNQQIVYSLIFGA